MVLNRRSLYSAAAFAVVAIFLAIPVFSQTARGSHSLPNARIFGAEDQAKQVSVTFWLKQRDKAGLDELVRQMYDRNSPNYHHWLTQKEYQARFAPSAADMAIVRQHLAANNLREISTDKWNHSVTVRGAVSDVQRATGVQLNRAMINGETHRLPSGELSIRGDAGKVILAVQGLSDLKYQNYAKRRIDPDTGKAIPLVPLPKSAGVGPAEKFFFANCLGSTQTHDFRAGSGGPYAIYTGTRFGNGIFAGPPNLPPCGYDSPQVDKAYGLTSLYKQKLDGTGQTIVIVDAFGSDTITSDANIFSEINGLPALTSSNFAIYYPTGATNCGGNTCGWDVETSLDVEWSHTVAPGANIALLLAADNSFTNLDLSVLYAIETGLGPVVSNSYGIGEIILATYDPAELVVQDNINETGAALGVSVNFSSGDDGDFYLDYGVTTVSAPASSSFATGVGGTSLFLNPDHSIKLQTGWGNNLTRIANVLPNPPVIPPLQLGSQGGSGGGTSGYYAKPSYQSGLPGDFRLVPDISYVADPFTGAEFIVTEGGQVGIGVVGGTSLACPMFSAMWAIATQASGTWLGNAAPILYTLPADAITDVTNVDGPHNVSGTIYVPHDPPIVESADDLAAPLGNTTNFVSTLYNSPFSSRWFVLTFGTDSSLTTGPGWDNVTGLGTPNGASFVSAVAAAAAPAK